MAGKIFKVMRYDLHGRNQQCAAYFERVTSKWSRSLCYNGKAYAAQKQYVRILSVTETLCCLWRALKAMYGIDTILSSRR